MTIRITDEEIELVGHARDKARCGQAWILTVSLMDYLDNVLGEDADAFRHRSGYSHIDRTRMRTREAAVLLDYYVHALRSMSDQMPDHFTCI